MFSYQIALNYWEVLLLILVRITSFVYTAPFFSIRGIPNRVKVIVSLFLSILVFTLIPDRTIEYTGVIDFAIIVLKEAVVGLLLGFVCNLCLLTINFAGHIIDTNIGLSMSAQFDPASGSQVTVSGQLYHYTVYLILIITGLYQFLISGIVDSYEVIPLNSVAINAKLYDSFLDAVAEYLIIGFRIALPVFVGIMLVNAILGVLSKVASQLNMFAVGIQIKLLAGFAIMYVTVAMLPLISDFIMDLMKKLMQGVMGGLS